MGAMAEVLSGVVHAVGSSGGAKRRFPTGAAAYGIEWKRNTPSAEVPVTGPESVWYIPEDAEAAVASASAAGRISATGICLPWNRTMCQACSAL